MASATFASASCLPFMSARKKSGYVFFQFSIVCGATLKNKQRSRSVVPSLQSFSTCSVYSGLNEDGLPLGRLVKARSAASLFDSFLGFAPCAIFRTLIIQLICAISLALFERLA